MAMAVLNNVSSRLKARWRSFHWYSFVIKAYPRCCVTMIRCPSAILAARSRCCPSVCWSENWSVSRCSATTPSHEASVPLDANVCYINRVFVFQTMILEGVLCSQMRSPLDVLFCCLPFCDLQAFWRGLPISTHLFCEQDMWWCGGCACGAAKCDHITESSVEPFEHTGTILSSDNIAAPHHIVVV